jgi:membrane-associated protein
MHPALALPSWMDAQYWLDMFGPWALWGALAIVFAECGLLLGFFLPGDSLLFTVGLLISTGSIKEPLWLACVLLTLAAFVGNVSGYEIGLRSGPAIFRREDSKLFKREYVDKTVTFFETYGPRAIVLARFVPIVRTFITVTAGVGRMDRRRYLLYSGIGGTLWATGVTVLGSLLGRFEFVKKNIEFMLLLVVAVSVVPIAVEFLRERARRGRGRAATENPPVESPAFPQAVEHAVNGHEAPQRSAYDGQAFGRQPYAQAGYEGYEGYAQPTYPQHQPPAYPQQGYPQQQAYPQQQPGYPQQEPGYDQQGYAQPGHQQQPPAGPAEYPAAGEELEGPPRRGGRHAGA